MKRTEKKQLAILTAAKQKFLTEGFSATTMSDIAKLAEVSSRTLYLHFPNKELLFQAVLKEHWHSLPPLQANFLPEKVNPAQALKRFAEEFLDFMYLPETQSLYRLLVAESLRFPDLCEGLISEGKGPLTHSLINYLKTQVASKIFTIEDVELATSQFMGLLKEDQFWPFMLGFIPAIDHSRTEKIIEAAVNSFLKTYSSQQ